MFIAPKCLIAVLFLAVGLAASKKYDARVVEDSIQKLQILINGDVGACLSKALTAEQADAFNALKSHASGVAPIQWSQVTNVSRIVSEALKKIPSTKTSPCPVAGINTDAVADIVKILAENHEDWQERARKELSANGLDALRDAVDKFKLILKSDPSKCLSKKLTSQQVDALNVLKAHTKGASLNVRSTIVQLAGSVPIGGKCPVAGLNGNALGVVYDAFAKNPESWEDDISKSIYIFERIISTDVTACISKKLTAEQKAGFAALTAHGAGQPIADTAAVRQVVLDVVGKIRPGSPCPLSGVDVPALGRVFDVYAATPVPAGPRPATPKRSRSKAPGRRDSSVSRR